jgi:hypothetical protein
MTKITKAPAMANELTSTPISFRILFPTNRKTIIIAPAVIDAFPASICQFLLKAYHNRNRTDNIDNGKKNHKTGNDLFKRKTIKNFHLFVIKNFAKI